MLKARNIIILFCVNYLIAVFVSAFIETAVLSQKAALIQSMIQVAADAALEQVQVSDDFFTTDGYGTTNAEYKIKAPNSSGTGYNEVNMYQALSGKTTREEIYLDAFGGAKTRLDSSASAEDGFNSWVRMSNSVKTMVARLNSGGVTYFYVPKVLQMGTDNFPLTGLDVHAVNPNGTIGNTATYEGVTTYIDNYKWKSVKRGGSYAGTSQDYYVTPISLGMTYINYDYVQKMFINNMDLLMRTQFTTDLSNAEGVIGDSDLTRTMAYASLVDSTSLDGGDINPINNGIFTFLRGEEETVATTDGTVTMYTGFDGWRPKIEYKVVDMYDTDLANSDLMRMLFAKDASYLKTQAKRLQNGQLAQENRIIVAKVTFYAPIIVPYESMISKEFRGMADDSGNLATRFFGTFGNDIHNTNNNGTMNFLDVNMWKTGDIDDYIIEYTRFFAVAP